MEKSRLRRGQILHLLEKNGAMSCKELATWLDVSEMTILRRSRYSLGFGILCFRPLFWAARSSAKGSGKSFEELDIEIIEPEESEEERQFREYGDCYGYSYYGDDK